MTPAAYRHRGHRPNFLLNCLEHLLAYRLFVCYLFDFLLGCLKFFKPNHFILGIIKSKVRVNIHCYRNARMPHKVLQSLGVHSYSRHIATVCMSTNMRSDVRHLYLENVIVSLDCVIESVFPMHGYFRHSILISEKKSGITLNHYLGKVCRSVFNDCLKHLENIIRHRKFPCSGISLGRFDNVLAPGSSLQLMINVDGSIFHIYIL